jgi:hypothetical protein
MDINRLASVKKRQSKGEQGPQTADTESTQVPSLASVAPVTNEAIATTTENETTRTS